MKPEAWLEVWHFQIENELLYEAVCSFCIIFWILHHIRDQVMMCTRGMRYPALLIAYIQHKIFLSNDITVFHYIFTVSLVFHCIICLSAAVQQFF